MMEAKNTKGKRKSNRKGRRKGMLGEESGKRVVVREGVVDGR